MKKTTKYFAIICTGVLAIAGCQIDEINKADTYPGDVTIIEASLSSESIEFKTQMSPGAETNKYKVEWLADDAVQMNGYTSTAISIGSDASNATFEFADASFDAPYYAVYPASSTAGYADGTYTLSLPSTQNYAGSDKFAPEGALMLGYSTTSGNVAFKHAMAFIRLTLTAGEVPIKSVTFDSNGNEAMSGAFTATCADGTWALSKASTGSSCFVELDCGESGAAIGERMIIAIPAGTYSGGFSIYIKNTNSQYQKKKSTNSFTAEAGCIYDMSFDFESQGTVVDGNIYDAEDWAAIAALIEDGNTFEGQKITLMNDLTVDTYFAYAKGIFEGTFDGNGKTLTANQNKWPLFQTIGEKGVVKNLTMDGSFEQYANAAEVGNATIAKINKGLIQDVTNYTDTELEGTFIFGHIVTQNGGTLERCKNYGNMTLTYTASGNSGFYGGGLCAIGHTTSGAPSATAINVDDTCSPGQFIDCENHGDLIFTAAAGKAVRQGFGGICGVVYFNGVKFDGCENYGDISRISNGETSNNFSSSIGGILGRSAAWYKGDSGGPLDTSTEGYDTEFASCINEGTIYSSCIHSGALTKDGTFARNDGVGGIVGSAIGNSLNQPIMIRCTNTGDVTGGWTTQVNATALGGLVGIASNMEISDSDAICNIMSASTEFIGAAGGLVACAITNVTVKDGCIACPTMDIYSYTGKPFLYGLIFGNIKGTATVTSASVAGSIKADGTDKAITSSNYTEHLVSSGSNTKLTSPVTTWYTAQ